MKKEGRDDTHMDITTYRLNRPKGQFSKNYIFSIEANTEGGIIEFVSTQTLYI